MTAATSSGAVQPGGHSLGFLPQLDAMRAAAIGIVIIAHAGLEHIIPGGFGVTLFFFLSGFLITSLLRMEAAQTGKIDLGAFYLRRAVRIFPPMFITIAFAALLCRIGLIDRTVTEPGVAGDYLFLTNYAQLLGMPGGVPIPLWSLDVEEHFYIAFSTLFALILAHRKPRSAAAILAQVCLGILAIRIAYVAAGSNLQDIYYWSHTRIDSILFGSILALWRNPVIDADGLAPRPGLVALAIAVCLACFLIRDEVFRQTLRYTLQGLALIVIFAFALNLKGLPVRLAGSWAVRWVAVLSYTLYLIHYPLLKMTTNLGWPLAWLSAFILAFIYALAMYFAVERPLGRWRRRFEVARRARDADFAP